MVLLDLETSGVDIARDRTVELGAVHCPSDARFCGGCFSTVVRVDASTLEERGAAAFTVHGIADEEIAAGPDFPLAWRRFLAWVDDLLNMATAETDDSDDDEQRVPQLQPDPPVLLLAGHNALRFDFPLLLSECLRHCLPCDCFEQWLFVDTLHVAQALAPHGCRRLQCLVKQLGDPADLRAHRALPPQFSSSFFVCEFVYMPAMYSLGCARKSKVGRLRSSAPCRRGVGRGIGYDLAGAPEALRRSAGFGDQHCSDLFAHGRVKNERMRTVTTHSCVCRHCPYICARACAVRLLFLSAFSAHKRRHGAQGREIQSRGAASHRRALTGRSSPWRRRGGGPDL